MFFYKVTTVNPHNVNDIGDFYHKYLVILVTLCTFGLNKYKYDQ